MNKAKLLKLINDLPENANVVISVDISTDEKTVYDRVFLDDIHFLELQENHNMKNYSLLATGSLNFNLE